MPFQSPQNIYRLRITLKSAVAAAFMGGAYTVLDDLVRYRDQFPTVKTGLLVGFLIGISLTFLEQFVLSQNFKRKPFLATLLVRSLSYALVSAFWLILVNAVMNSAGSDFIASAAFYLSSRLLIDFVFSCLAAVLVVSLLQINSLHNPGELLKFVSGTYHDPQEVNRIFMFVDLKSSTTLAEQMGNIRYSRFLQDFFYDITDAILLSKAEIYQYVGDEVILSWPYTLGIRDALCLHCFYRMKKNIAAREKAYRKQYGFAPQFKAGVHGGPVVVTWVGEIKKEIVYHGDVLNTTARIQSMCNKLEQELIISGQLYEDMRYSPDFMIEYVDTILLKGKRNEIEIYGVKGAPGQVAG
ncbi:MAG: adenylate/guanylate cyclase domain-containing protein [Mucilaginibacter polytrichastri]|nr:adenylate/guanylate cyclase domain-containing protein [Mucilaginibacter polytrichastri]